MKRKGCTKELKGCGEETFMMYTDTVPGNRVEFLIPAMR